MVVKLKDEEAKIISQFMMRTNLQGAEVQAFNTVMIALNKIEKE